MYFYGMRTLLKFTGISLIFLLPFSMNGQTSKKVIGISPDLGPDATVFDTYLGITERGDTFLHLYLQHCQYCDEGAFDLNEMHGHSIGRIIDHGNWTVLRGSAKDRNSTVVELDGKHDTLYYLRLKTGDLQQLDSGLREMTPAKNYMLLKQ
jgi:hypothetical protein